tara:strand:- start:2122 stop:2691 length:570 start_codon:yes stop_codon:yes gene_type:complete
MPNPKGILTLLKQMQKGRTGQFIGKSRSEASFGKKHLYSDWDRSKQASHIRTDIPFGERSPIQQGARDLLAKAIKVSKPRITESTAQTQAQGLFSDLRRHQQAAIEARKLNKFREAAKHQTLAKEANKTITDYVKKMRTEALAVPALAKMAETTMMPEKSFMEKWDDKEFGREIADVLMDVLSPIPRYK